MIGTMTIRLGTVRVFILERRLSTMVHHSPDRLRRPPFMAHTQQQLRHLRLTVFAPVAAHVKRVGMYESIPNSWKSSSELVAQYLLALLSSVASNYIASASL